MEIIKSKKNLWFLLLVIPSVFDILAVRKLSWWPLGTVVSIFLIIAFCPLFRRRETMWAFILGSVFLTPVMFRYSYIAVRVMFHRLFWLDDSFFEITCFLMLFCIVISICLIAVLFVSRVIWRRQYDIFTD